ncbi:bacillopeptidase F [Folsomia candida]|nr:bacillopeptidase F [Folsomia candida]
MSKFVLLLALAATAVYAAPSSKIEARLAATLAFSSSTANVLVSFPGTTGPVLARFEKTTFATRGARATAIADALRANSVQAQSEARALLDSASISYEVFWITNQIYIRNADAALVSKLAGLQSVAEISQEFEVSVIPHHIEGQTARKAGILAEWGVENIEAPAAWALPGGNNGAGAIVAGIDTGVHATHIDLADNFVGTNYGWRDVTLFGTQTPRDDNGHGTHTMGTIVGANGIGVAPGARWIACKALSAQGSGTNAGLISCGQWVACPTLPNGQSPDCTKIPHVVSNSWGGGQANPFYNEVINTWHSMNIVPIFANGNSGPACTTANSPADSLAGVIGVGATTDTNGLASFSSKGPTIGGRPKPDISAPGQNIRSAWHTPGTNAYNTISGTSMAAPHVAGVAALLKAHNSDLTWEQINANMNSNANTQNVVPTGQNCGGVDESIFPNMAFGSGIVNARASLAAAIAGK